MLYQLSYTPKNSRPDAETHAPALEKRNAPESDLPAGAFGLSPSGSVP